MTTVQELIDELMESCNGNTSQRVVVQIEKVEGMMEGDNLKEPEAMPTVAGSLWRAKCNHDLVESEPVTLIKLY